jgi:hypothetical protein
MVFTHIFIGNFNFKGLTSRRLYKSFNVKGLNQGPYKVTISPLRNIYFIEARCLRLPVIPAFPQAHG